MISYIKRLLRLIFNWMKKLNESLFNANQIDSNENYAAQINKPLPTHQGEKPGNYGKFWQNHDGGLEWYTWMYETRIEQHLCFQEWFKYINSVEKVNSVAEFGCGLAVGYADFFKDIRYVGLDMAESSISWCQQNRKNKKHEYIITDFIANPVDEKFDVVFSQGTIDNSYNIEGFLQAAINASQRWIYITAYRGFFPELEKHVYTLNEDQGCFYNDLSPLRIYEFLKNSGCTEIAVVPSYTGKEEIPFEALFIARVKSHAI